MKVLELFAGSQSFARAARDQKHTTFTTDSEPFEGIDYVVDILDFDTSQVPFVPDIIWASPPCTAFSVASIGTHWESSGVPKTDAARHGIRLIEKTLEIIKYFQDQNTDLKFYIENPRGMLRKLPVVAGLPLRRTVSYCQYGDERMKPTDIWTNDWSWVPRQICKTGGACHVAAPRGSRTGTQGRVGSFERSKVPLQLCSEILEANG